MRTQVLEDMISSFIPEKAYSEQWEIETLHEEILRVFALDMPIADWAKEEGIADAEIHERLSKAIDEQNKRKIQAYGAEVMRDVEKSLLLQLLDQLWKDHLLTLDHLRQGIGLRSYAQQDPLNEYKREAFNLFEDMLNMLRERITQVISHLEMEVEGIDLSPLSRTEQVMTESREDPAFSKNTLFWKSDNNAEVNRITQVTRRQAAETLDPQDSATWGRISRNTPCPCNSGRKYKHCHGKIA
jgi:preprotein translocase subunit SecA